jgi:Flp pilus assembly protein TadG
MFIGFGERSQGSKVMNKLFEKSRGQVFVLYTLALVALLGALALGTDVAVMYVNWQQAQKVADAAALAGANFLQSGKSYADKTTGAAFPVSTGCNGETSGTSPEEVASQVACTYAVNNGLAASTVTISNPSSTSIQVVAHEAGLPYFFAKVLPGMSSYTVTASAGAAAPGPVETVLGTTAPGGTEGLFPVGLQCAAPCSLNTSLVAGEHLTFGTKFISATVNAPGNWDWLGPDGGGASQVGNDVANGASGTYAIGDTINTAPGNKANSGPIKKAFAARMASCPSLVTDPCADSGNPNDIPAGDPCAVIMPAVDFTGVTGKKPVTIEQFAEVYLESDSTSTNIDGCFIQTVTPGTLATGGTGGTTVTSFGPSAPPTLTN